MGGRNRKGGGAIWPLAAIALALAGTPVMAQTTPPGAAPTREELERADRVAPEQTPSRLSVEGGIERAPCPLADPRYSDVKAHFSAVRFDGLKQVSPDALSDSWADFANREVPVSVLCEIRDRAATALRAMGYLAAVQVPPQRIEKGGTVRFDILMARLVRVEVRGDAGNSERLIAGHLEALTGQPVFNSHEAERHLLLARDLPGYDVRLALRPAGTAPGEVVGEVRVTRERVRVDVNIHNLGSRSAGRFGGLARVQFNDLTGMGDSTTLSLFNTAQTSGQTVLQAGHSMALNSSGLRLSGDVTYAWSEPDIGADVKSETLIASVAASYPLIRRQAKNLSASGGIDIVDQDVRLGGIPLFEDRLRVLFARLDGGMSDPESLASTLGYSAAEPRWRIGGSVELRHGIAGLGASSRSDVDLSRVGADPSAFVLRASASGEFRPVPAIAFVVAPRAQYSADPLLSFEEMSAGNYTVGRGYDPGIIAGDKGLGFATEARMGSIMPHSPQDLALQPFAFFDAAWMWNEDAGLAGTGPLKAYSTGGGVRGAWGNRARFDLTLAVPLHRSALQTRRGDARLLFSVTTQLWPWRP